MSAAVHFSIKYDGPALVTHQMDVRELAPALIALSELLEQANKAAFPDAPEVRVNVNGSFRSGSFEIDLIAIQSLAQQLVSLLTGPEASAASNLSGILGGIGMGGAGLIGLVKWLRGRRPSTIRLEGDRAVFEIRVTGAGGEVAEFHEVSLVTEKLYRSRQVRQSLAKVLKPLAREGIDSFACSQDGGTFLPLALKADVHAFDLAAEEAEVVSSSLSERVLLQIEAAVFKSDNKWKFSDGSTAFHAEIADADFMARINAGAERFGKGDVLVVDLRRIQSVTDSGLRLEHVVEKVHEHRAPLQQSLPLR